MVAWGEVQPAGNTTKNWRCCAISGNGAVVIADVYSGRIYLSRDKGVTWTETQPAGNIDLAWVPCAVNNDASLILAGVDAGRIYISHDKGATWTCLLYTSVAAHE